MGEQVQGVEETSQFTYSIKNNSYTCGPLTHIRFVMGSMRVCSHGLCDALQLRFLSRGEEVEVLCDGKKRRCRLIHILGES
jgi:hypothetical protein